MPSDRATAPSLGRAARDRSSRATASAGDRPAVAQPAAERVSVKTSTARSERIAPARLTVGIQHVFEAHPLRVEVEVDVSDAAVAVLPHQQLRGALDLAAPI